MLRLNRMGLPSATSTSAFPYLSPPSVNRPGRHPRLCHCYLEIIEAEIRAALKGAGNKFSKPGLEAIGRRVGDGGNQGRNRSAGATGAGCNRCDGWHQAQVYVSAYVSIIEAETTHSQNAVGSCCAVWSIQHNGLVQRASRKGRLECQCSAFRVRLQILKQWSYLGR